MPKGIPLHKLMSKETLSQLYAEIGSIEGVHKRTGFDQGSIRKLLSRYEIEFKYKTKYSHDDLAFEQDNEASYYWAGFIAADGCIKNKNKNTKILGVSLATKDRDRLQALKDFLKAEEKIFDFTSKKNKKYSQIHIVSNKIAETLANKFKIVPRKTYIYTFPENLNEELVHHFIRGYVDGDGCFSHSKQKNKKPQLTFSVCGSESFLKDCQNVLMKSAVLNKTKLVKRKNVFDLKYWGNINVSKVASYLYKNATIFMSRKHDIVKNSIILE